MITLISAFAGASPSEDAELGLRLRAAAEEARLNSSPESPPRFVIWLKSMFGAKEPTAKIPTASPEAPSAADARFPQCSRGQFTADAGMAEEMFRGILKIENGMQKTMIEDVPFKGTRAKFSLINQEGSLQIKIEASLKMILPAKICQHGRDIQVLLDNSNATGMARFAGKTIELNIQPRTGNQFFISDPGGNISNSYSTSEPETVR